MTYRCYETKNNFRTTWQALRCKLFIASVTEGFHWAASYRGRGYIYTFAVTPLTKWYDQRLIIQ